MFWPPAFILVAAVIAGIVDFDGFLKFATQANNFVLEKFDWLFSIASFSAIIIVIIVAISPLGKVRIGGDEAKPILTRWNWFAITLCTTIAIGILFWGAAEPMFHLHSPPGFSGAAPASPQAAQFAMSSMFLHWTITPYSLYAIPSLAFALAYYNYSRPYSLSAPISLLINKASIGRGGDIIDALALYALVAGVAAALGAGVLTVVGGANAMFGLQDTITLRFIITLIIVTAFIISSISGLHRGIKWLSDANARIFILIALFILITGPTLEIFIRGANGLAHYFTTLIPANLALGERGTDQWTRDWTVYFFANWLAWAPVTALFLGRISYGYTVREFLLFNLAIPALFSIVWMSILGGTAITFDLANDNLLSTALNNEGPEAVVYAMLSLLPAFKIVGIVFLVAVFISFVTAMDSNTLSIAGLCLKSNENDDAHNKHQIGVKIFWGLLIGSLSFIMTSTTGIDGVRMLSNLGGVPGLFILILSGALLLRLIILRPQQNVKLGSAD